MNEQKTWKHKDLNIPLDLLEKFDNVWPLYNRNWTDAIIEGMKLYLDKYEAKEAEKQ